MIGEAEIRDTFAISARGQVLVLAEVFSGQSPEMESLRVMRGGQPTPALTFWTQSEKERPGLP